MKVGDTVRVDFSSNKIYQGRIGKITELGYVNGNNTAYVDFDNEYGTRQLWAHWLRVIGNKPNLITYWK